MDGRKSIQTNKTVRELPLYVRCRMQGVPRWSLLLIHGWVHNKRLLRAFCFNCNRRFTKFNTVAAAQTSSSNSMICVVYLRPVKCECLTGTNSRILFSCSREPVPVTGTSYRYLKLVSLYCACSVISADELIRLAERRFILYNADLDKNKP